MEISNKTTMIWLIILTILVLASFGSKDNNEVEGQVDLSNIEERVLNVFNDVFVYLNGEYTGEYRVKTIYNKTFPNTELITENE